MNRITNAILALGICALCGLVVQSSEASAETVSSNYDIELFTGAGVETGEAALSVFLKSSAAGRSDRLPVSRIFGKPGTTLYNLTIEVDDIPVETDTVAVAFAGTLKMPGGRTLILPVQVYGFGPGQRRDKLPDSQTFKLSESSLTAFRRSYPISAYGCTKRLNVPDLARVVLASRVLLTERETYLTTDESWDCLETFFEKNAKALQSVTDAQLNDVMAFLSDYRTFQGSAVPDRFINLYLKFLREIVELNKMGSELSDRHTLKDQLRTELAEIMSDQTLAAVPFAGSLYENMSRFSAADLCIDNATTLFFGLNRQDDAALQAMLKAREDSISLVEYAMDSTMRCAVTLAQNDGADIRTLGLVAATAGWVSANRTDFLQSYIALYERLDALGWFTQNRTLTNPSAELVNDYYVAFFKAIPRPVTRPES